MAQIYNSLVGRGGVTFARGGASGGKPLCEWWVMGTIFDGGPRKFLIWTYTVSLRRLVLRSVKTSEYPTRIDVYFQDVKEFMLPTTLQGLRIVEGNEAGRHIARTGVSFDDIYNTYQVAGHGYVGFVVASLCTSSEDAGEHYEPSEVLNGPGWQPF